MKLIVITPEAFFKGEAPILNRLFEQGMETLHLRKPSAKIEELETLLLSIDKHCHNRIVLHDHFTLMKRYALKGVHLNRRNPVRPSFIQGSLSCSCHALGELEATASPYDYTFLSPIFDSISKQGYSQAFSEEQLWEAKLNNVIHNRVIALGGINEQNLSVARTYGFGGVAVLGALWGNQQNICDNQVILERFTRLNTLCHTP